MIGAIVDEVLKEMGNATDEGMKTADDYMDAETGLLMCRAGPPAPPAASGGETGKRT